MPPLADRHIGELFVMTYGSLLSQISEWHTNQQHEEIISAVRSLPQQKQTSELVCLLARALINIDDFSGALRLLDSIKETSQDGYYCIRYGLALYCLHREDEALQWFKQTQEKGIEEINELPGTYYPKSVSAWVERAERWAPRRIEKNAFEEERRKKRNKQVQENAVFEANVLEGLWDDCDYSLEEYVGEIPTDADFENVEASLGYRLPVSYKTLMKKHNGGILSKNIFENPLQRDWTPRSFSAESIYGVDCKKPYSLCGEMGSKFWIDEWKYPDIGIVICDTMSGGHDLIFLDYSDCGPEGEPCVVHIDQESDYERTYLADNFKDFIEGLFSEDESSED